jgi:hypothetical protein
MVLFPHIAGLGNVIEDMDKDRITASEPEAGANSFSDVGARPRETHGSTLKAFKAGATVLFRRYWPVNYP